MANYDDHISQTVHNLDFLIKINTLSENDFWDWHVTVCYYVAVHLINAHLAKTNLHYRKHEDVAHALNPYVQISPTKVSEEVYLAYTKLQNLSRRSRYLINENMSNRSDQTHLTYDKHFKKALIHLDKIMKFVSIQYNETFQIREIKCKEGNRSNYEFFIISFY